jgi:hypothetical protein
MLIPLNGEFLTFYLPDQQAEIDLPLIEPVELAEFLGGLGISAPEVQPVVLTGQLRICTGRAFATGMW